MRIIGDYAFMLLLTRGLNCLSLLFMILEIFYSIDCQTVEKKVYTLKLHIGFFETANYMMNESFLLVEHVRSH